METFGIISMSSGILGLGVAMSVLAKLSKLEKTLRERVQGSACVTCSSGSRQRHGDFQVQPQRQPSTPLGRGLHAQRHDLRVVPFIYDEINILKDVLRRSLWHPS